MSGGIIETGMKLTTDNARYMQHTDRGGLSFLFSLGDFTWRCGLLHAYSGAMKADSSSERGDLRFDKCVDWAKLSLCRDGVWLIRIVDGWRLEERRCTYEVAGAHIA